MRLALQTGNVHGFERAVAMHSTVQDAQLHLQTCLALHLMNFCYAACEAVIQAIM